ncbi:MAG: hypothetical protein IJJ69_09100 [Oscillospiraceae bacterium]|nr:hypothetical protein [Oscillospiraceae bacterium]
MNYDVGDALSRIETILLDSIGRNMKRHLKEEVDLQKAWSMWQTEQLAGLGNWSAKNYKQFAPQFTKINNSAMNLLQQANQNGELNEEIRILQTGIQNAQRFFDVPNDKLDSLLKAVRSDLSRAEHSILRKADDVYREALFDSHFYLQSGTGTLNSAIDMAVSDMHQRGMNSIVYRNGAHVSASVYARMALRTANERAQLLGEGKARDKFGIHTVIVPPSGLACPKCSVWLCKVLVDDVYSAGTPAEADELKLPLLSEAIRQGFLHPQCNCSPQTYFPESPVPEMSDSQREEAVRKYQITQKQRYHERQIRKWKQAEKSAPDEASKKSASARKREWQKRCKNLCDQNSDFLRRDYFREKIYDYQTPPIVPNVIDKPTPPEPTPKITETKPAVTAPEVQAIQNPVPMQNIISENSPKPLDFSAQSGIMELREEYTRYKPVTESAIQNMPMIPLFQTKKTGIPLKDKLLVAETSEKNKRYQKACQDLLREADKHKSLELGTEFGIAYDKNMNPIADFPYMIGKKGSVHFDYYPDEPFHALHNHPSGETFSFSDLLIFASEENMLSLSAVGNQNNLYVISETEKSDKLGYFAFLINQKKKNLYTAKIGNDKFEFSYDLLIIEGKKRRQKEKNLISALTKEQYEELENSLIKWSNECIEGCEKYGIQYQFKTT